MAEKSLRALELNPKLEAEINELKKLVKELENSKLTPCVVAINSFASEIQKLPMPAQGKSKSENKEIVRLRKELSGIWKKSIQAQCGWKDSIKWYQVILPLAPVIGAIITKL